MMDNIYVLNGCSNHCSDERQNEDFYATNPRDVELLFTECGLQFSPNILEPCAGNGHISNVLKAHGYSVSSFDIVQRDYPLDYVGDFLQWKGTFDGDIVTNPPYSLAYDFVNKSLDIIPNGKKVVMFLKLQFLEGCKRRKLFDTKQLKYVYVFSKRTNCAKNGDVKYFEESSAIAYAWYVWEKGYNSDPIIKWIN